MATVHVRILKGKSNSAGDTVANATQTDRGSEDSSSELELKKINLPYHPPNYYERSEVPIGCLERAAQSVTLRTPWVPAPGKTTNQTTISLHPLLRNSISSKENIKGTSSAVSAASSPRRKRLSRVRKQSTAERVNFQKNKGQNVKLKSRRDMKEKPYSLRSKDSLIDVTACLNDKREQLMKLWQDNLPSTDTYLLNLLEKTNDLALEAAEDVAKLRNSIQKLQKKSVLTEADSACLESMRNNVMTKLNSFEQANGEIHNLIGTPSSQQINEYGMRFVSKSSQAEVNGKTEEPRTSRSRSGSRAKSVSSQSQTDLIFLKNQAEHFFEHDTDNDANVLASETNSNSAVIKSCDSSSQVDLSRLNHLYNEQYILPGVKESYSHNPAKSGRKENIMQTQERVHRVVRFQDPHEESNKFYKEKLTEFQRKLASQESEVSDLKTELRRVESQSGFQLKLLKTNINDKLEELEVIPELLQLTEHRMGSNFHTRILMEQSLQEKERDLNSARGDMQKTLVELIDTKEKLKRSEIMNNSLGFQLQEVLRENDKLKQEMDSLQKSYSKAIEDKTKENSKLNNQLQHALKNQTSILVDDSSVTKENIKLAEKVLELEKNLAKAERDVRLQRKSKEKLATRMNRRVEELMENLEESRRRNRHWINQFQFIKTTYFKLFPIEMFLPKSGQNQTEKINAQENAWKIDNDLAFQQAFNENGKASLKEHSLNLRNDGDEVLDSAPEKLNSVPTTEDPAVKTERKKVVFEISNNDHKEDDDSFESYGSSESESSESDSDSYL